MPLTTKEQLAVYVANLANKKLPKEGRQMLYGYALALDLAYQKRDEKALQKLAEINRMVGDVVENLIKPN